LRPLHADLICRLAAHLHTAQDLERLLRIGFGSAVGADRHDVETETQTQTTTALRAGRAREAALQWARRNWDLLRYVSSGCRAEASIDEPELVHFFLDGAGEDKGVLKEAALRCASVDRAQDLTLVLDRLERIQERRMNDDVLDYSHRVDYVCMLDWLFETACSRGCPRSVRAILGREHVEQALTLPYHSVRWSCPAYVDSLDRMRWRRHPALHVLGGAVGARGHAEVLRTVHEMTGARPGFEHLCMATEVGRYDVLPVLLELARGKHKTEGRLDTLRRVVECMSQFYSGGEEARDRMLEILSQERR